MDDAKHSIFSSFSRLIKRNHHRSLLSDSRSAAVGAQPLAVRPRISLKARMLGGQAETISCFRGTWH